MDLMNCVKREGMSNLLKIILNKLFYTSFQKSKCEYK